MKLYTILYKNGSEMPMYYSGRYRTEEEALRLLKGLNESGEYRPYRMVEIGG